MSHNLQKPFTEAHSLLHPRKFWWWWTMTQNSYCNLSWAALRDLQLQGKQWLATVFSGCYVSGDRPGTGTTESTLNLQEIPAISCDSLPNQVYIKEGMLYTSSTTWPMNLRRFFQQLSLMGSQYVAIGIGVPGPFARLPQI